MAKRSKSTATSIALRTLCCASCRWYCGVVKCPKCHAVRWLDDWEVYDDFAVCPAYDCIVPYYLSMSTVLDPPKTEAELPSGPHYLLCRAAVAKRAYHEECTTGQAKKRKRRKPKKLLKI
jgi:hypothetical protein